MKFSEIYEGWRNHMFPPERLKEEIAKVSEERLTICETCEFNSKFHKSVRPDVHCVVCGCTLVAKTKCLSCSCPKEKWQNVITEEQETIIEEHEREIDSSENSIGGSA